MNIRTFKTLFAVSAVAALTVVSESCSHNAGSTIEFETRVDSVGYVMPDFYGDTVYTAAKYSVVWPEKIGQEDFNALRDSLLQLTFGSNSGSSTFDEAAKKFMLAGIDELRTEGDTTFVYNQVPYDTAYAADRRNLSVIISDVRLLTPKLLVVQVYNYSYYYGAAHGMQTVRYLNYNIANRTLMNASNIFKPGNDTAILDLINNSAKEHYPEEGTLFPDPISTFGSIELTEDEVVFVYQPYDVAPYSTGIVRVPVNIFDLHRFLTPEAAATLSDN